MLEVSIPPGNGILSKTRSVMRSVILFAYRKQKKEQLDAQFLKKNCPNVIDTFDICSPRWGHRGGASSLLGKAPCLRDKKNSAMSLLFPFSSSSDLITLARS
jgi:hypothetical protein